MNESAAPARRMKLGPQQKGGRSERVGLGHPLRFLRRGWSTYVGALRLLAEQAEVISGDGTIGSEITRWARSQLEPTLRSAADHAVVHPGR